MQDKFVRFVRFIRLIAVLAVLFLAASIVMPAFAQAGDPPPVQESTVTLPIELQALIAAGIGYLVTQGLKGLSALFGKDLSGSAAAISASVVTSLMLFLNTILAAVPDFAAPVVSAVLTLIVSVLLALGVYKTVKGFQPVPAKK